jgi:DNA-binding NtrC family response regulator
MRAAHAPSRLDVVATDEAPAPGTLRIEDRPGVIQRFRLEVAGRTVFDDARPRIVIGCHASVDVHLDDPTVSRFHCEIFVERGRAVIRDLESKNGTRVDGVSVIEAHLDGPATIGVGSSELRFIPGDEQVSVPLSAESRFGGLVGASTVMRAAYAILEAAAASNATVLIQGETGTGKDVAAEAIHGRSARRSGPFVIVDCGSIPRGLIEAELFGHEKGAFTGADRARPGAFEQASGGTLLLDEIGELPRDLQPRLLRVLTEREVQRVGGHARIPVDVRVVAATNRDLRLEVNAGRFRPDLFYRVAVVEVTMPPLRDRAEDLRALVEHFLDERGLAGTPAAEPLLAPRFLAGLRRHPWPGNVRELGNYLDRCLATTWESPPALEPDQRHPPPLDVDEPFPAVRDRWLRHGERRYLEALLARHDGNISAAARAAGIDRVQLYRLLARCGLRPRG